nr:CheR family methyltransferase [Candidatus Goldiibacteriota bacterium]
IKDSIKKKVKFIRANLMKPYLKEQFDFVFCRNVIIYFSRELQKNVLLYFHEALKKGGIFFMGKTETMLLEYRDKFKCINIKERIFTKLEEEKGE